MDLFHTTHQVAFSDTDMAGIVHFSHYFKYMENTEHAFFRSLGLSVFMPYEETTITWPRVSCSFDFKKPIKFEEIVDIYLEVEEIGNKHLKYVATIKKQEEICAIGRTTIICCSYSKKEGLKSIAIPQIFKDHFLQ